MKSCCIPVKLLLLALLLPAGLNGCSTMGNAMNPFHQPPSPNALRGEATDRALQGDSTKEESARRALEQVASYQAAHAPQPHNPVLNPPIVRLMWVPDRLNRHGDMVPAHYYYLRVLPGRWALQDAFEIESQLGGAGSAASNVPFTYSNKRGR